MLTLGLTGSFGTGKTTVARLFKEKGARIIDADRISKQLLTPKGKCFLPVVRRFGEGILKSGRIDREKLSEIVFKDQGKLQVLNRIIHPAVAKRIKAEINALKKAKNRFVVLDVPLLIEAGLRPLVDILIVVKASRKLQLARVTQRMRISQKETAHRINAQMSIKDKIRWADIVIDNRGSLTKTKKQVNEIWQRLLKKKQKN